jgi:hypothetical protein
MKRKFTANQIFVGLPWKNVRGKYDKIIPQLEKKYPLHFTIVGRNDGQDASDLFEIIKSRILSSSYGIFDATSGNANVSLEYGYAEGIDLPRSIFLSAHKAAQKTTFGSPIISDLTGKRRMQYKTEKALIIELNKLCKEHDYTKRFERTLTRSLKRKSRGAKKSGRSLALKIIRILDGKGQARRADIVQKLQADGYKEKEINEMLKKMHINEMIKCTVGKFSDVYIK